MPYNLSEMTLEETLRSYSSIKGHRTRVEREIGNLLRLLSATYSAPSETRLNEALEKLQNHTHRLSDIADYLTSLKYAKAKDHAEEVEDFKEILNKCSDEVFKLSTIVMHQETINLHNLSNNNHLVQLLRSLLPQN